MSGLNQNALAASAINTSAQGYAGIQGAYSQSQAMKEQARFESDNLRFQASLSDRRAKESLEQGEFAVRRLQREGKKLQGAQAATAAAQGVVVGKGNAAQLQMEAARDAAEDAAIIRNNALLESWGHQVEGLGLRTQAKMTKIGARQRSAQTMMGAGVQFGRDLVSGYESAYRMTNYLDELEKKKS